MSRRLTFALAAAVLVASSTASAWDPSIVGLEDDNTPAITDSTPALASSEPASAFEPTVVGDDGAAVTSPAATSSATVCAESRPSAARVTPEMVGEAAEAERAPVSRGRVL